MVFIDMIWNRIDMAPLQAARHAAAGSSPRFRTVVGTMTFLAALHHNWTIGRCLDRFTRANAPTPSNPVDGYEQP
ncbi:hypothetical protein V1286_001179 [Bradyrhizobium algeriense]|uniref:Uncharacterized protein n=1 Tax=Bradyrhizobium algeriense TaxID=634784 RepID=A0ABU8B541_9BRAD